MAKKYHQTIRDRLHEAEPRHHKKRKSHHKHHEHREHHERHGHYAPSHDFITGHDPEVGKNDFAGLPPETMMASYPPNRARRGGYLDDTMSEIDAIQTDSDHQVESHLSHQK
jgi:hypothetical protein